MKALRPRLRWVGWGVTAGVFFLLALLIQAPAALLPWLLQRLSMEGLRWQGVSGTVWRGEAEGVFWQTETASQPLGRLSWRWRPAELASGRLTWQIELSGAGNDLQATLGRGLDAWQVRQAHGHLPASMLVGLWPTLRLIHPQGRLELAAPDLSLGRKGARGALRLDWYRAGSALVSAPLGDYRLQLTAAGTGLEMDLMTLQGPLQAQGRGRWRPGEGLNLTVELRPPTTNRVDYAPALDLLARADTAGNYRIEWSSTPAR